MSEENKALVRRELEEVWNKHNLDAIDEIYAPDFVDHSAPPGMPNDRAGAKARVGAFLGAFPDFKTTIDILVAEIYGDFNIVTSSSVWVEKLSAMGHSGWIFGRKSRVFCAFITAVTVMTSWDKITKIN